MKRKNKKLNLAWVRFWRSVIFFMLGGLCLFFIYQKVLTALRETDYFRIKEVLYDPTLEFIRPQLVQALIGRNLFSVNANELHQHLQRQYPQIANLRISKRFPDKVLIIAKQRIPFSQLKYGDQVLTVDKEGTVLSVNLPVTGSLPCITGVKAKKAKIQTGAVIHGKSFWLALDLIEKFQLNPKLSAYKIDRLDISSLSQISIFLLANPKIILDNENVEQKLKILGVMFTQGQMDLTKINYIDLRFKEPVLGKK